MSSLYTLCNHATGAGLSLSMKPKTAWPTVRASSVSEHGYAMHHNPRISNPALQRTTGGEAKSPSVEWDTHTLDANVLQYCRNVDLRRGGMNPARGVSSRRRRPNPRRNCSVVGAAPACHQLLTTHTPVRGEWRLLRGLVGWIRNQLGSSGVHQGTRGD